MKLYDTLRSGNAWKVRLMASLLGLSLQRHTLSIDRGDLASPAFRGIAPLGRVPILELPGGQRIAESAAILFYLAQDTHWWPKSTLAQAQVLSWLSFEQEVHMKPLALLRLHLALRRDRDAASAEFVRLAHEARTALTLLEGQLHRQGESAWVATSDHPSIADVALYPYTRMAPMGDMALDEYPAIRTWLAKIEALPGYEALFPGDASRNLSTEERP